MDTIDSRHVGVVDGFNINARIVPDTDTTVAELGGYTSEQIKAWHRDDWSYVGTIVTASKAGIELGSASLWGSEYGLLPGVDGWVSPLDGEGDTFVNGYGPRLITEAIAEAKAKLAELVSGTE